MIPLESKKFIIKPFEDFDFSLGAFSALAFVGAFSAFGALSPFDFFGFDSLRKGSTKFEL